MTESLELYRFLRLLAGAPLAAGLCALPALAGPASLCVSCSEPAQSYVCSVDSPLSQGSQALQLFCVVKIAKEGGHKSCAVSKDPEGARCPGIVKSYRYDGPDIPSQLRSGDGNFAAAPQTPPTKPGSERSGPPETLVQVGKGAGQTVGSAAKGAGHAAKSAGSRIGDAARNAFDCVVSLFRGCGSKTE